MPERKKSLVTSLAIYPRLGLFNSNSFCNIDIDRRVNIFDLLINELGSNNTILQSDAVRVLWISWDSGSKFAIIEGTDEFEILEC
jgi:hypothetical protein